VRGQNDYLICIAGAIKVCIYDDERGSRTKGELDEIEFNGDEKLQVVRVVGACWHGHKVIGTKPAFILYGVTRLYRHQNPDEKRRPWDDRTVIPTSINGRMDDSRVGKPYDWNASEGR
jgi:dTDP-4-dehydrorhamnose 3,5-epimerase